MNFNDIVRTIILMMGKFMDVLGATYNMIVNNILLLIFVLVFAIFVGLALLKRLIHT